MATPQAPAAQTKVIDPVAEKFPLPEFVLVRWGPSAKVEKLTPKEAREKLTLCMRRGWEFYKFK